MKIISSNDYKAVLRFPAGRRLVLACDCVYSLPLPETELRLYYGKCYDGIGYHLNQTQVCWRVGGANYRTWFTNVAEDCTVCQYVNYQSESLDSFVTRCADTFWQSGFTPTLWHNINQNLWPHGKPLPHCENLSTADKLFHTISFQEYYANWSRLKEIDPEQLVKINI